MSDVFRWGLISTGDIVGRAFLPALAESGGGEALAVASRTKEKAEAYARERNIPRAYGSYEELLADPDIDGVYIAVPNTMHEEWIVKSAAAGKHVFCEKPLTMTVAEARSAIAACEKAGVLLIEAFVYLFHRHTERIKALVDEGAIGDVRHADARFHIGMPALQNIRMVQELGGGALMDIGSYAVNWVRFVMGDVPTRLAAHSVWHPSGVDQTTTAVMRFSQGRTANISSTFGMQGGEFAAIYGTDGVLEVNVPFHPSPERARMTLRKGREAEEITVPMPRYPFTDAIATFQRVARGEASFAFDVLKEIIDQATVVGAVRTSAVEERWFDLEAEAVE